MTDREHLIENAIIYVENGKDFEYFLDDINCKEMAKRSGVELENVWEMAVYVHYNYRPWLIEKYDLADDLSVRFVRELNNGK